MSSTDATELVDSLVLKSSGSWNQIEISKWPIPKSCGKEEIKVSVDYCGINFADVYSVQGILINRKTPFVFGLECVGTILELGENTDGFKVGERVACYMAEGGLFQEKIVVSKSHCFPVPQNIPSTDAAAIITNYLTAYFCLFYSSNLRPDSSVLIHSVAGGVGWAATQLAHTVSNVKVYGTCSESKHSIVKSNGVDIPLTYDNYMKTDIKFDIVIDNMGGESLKTGLELLKPLGHLVSIGANSVVSDDQEVVTKALQSIGNNVEMQPLVFGNKGVSGLHLGTLLAGSPQTIQKAMKHLFELYELGKIKPHIDSIWPFNKGGEAMRLLADRKNVGKVVLQVKKESD